MPTWESMSVNLQSIVKSIEEVNPELKVRFTRHTSVTSSLKTFSYVQFPQFGTITMFLNSPKKSHCSIDVVMMPKNTLLYHGWHTNRENGLTEPTWFSLDKDMAKYHVLIAMAGSMHLNEKETIENINKLNPKLLVYETMKMVPVLWFNSASDYTCFCKMVNSEGCYDVFTEGDKILANTFCMKHTKIAGWIFLEDEGQVMLCQPDVYIRQLDNLHEMIRPKLWEKFVHRMLRYVRYYKRDWDDAFYDAVFDNWDVFFDRRNGIQQAYLDPDVTNEQKQMANDAWVSMKDPNQPIHPEEERGHIFPNTRNRLRTLVSKVKQHNKAGVPSSRYIEK